ncbi:MAG: hypothetical protein ACJ8AW_51270 [Rhodopila sp.]
MKYRVWVLILLPLGIAACSSSPYAPVNQATPVRQMDSFFSGGRTDYQPPPPGYRYEREYDTGGYYPRY